MKFIKQYSNLSREIWVLFFGRIVTCMGSFIWPLLTLIMRNKLGYSASFIAILDSIMLIMQFPMLLIGGKLADSKNRKTIIVICDMITVTAYIICGLLPISNYSIAIIYIAGVFATIEGPSYDALIADLCTSETRDSAYSLQYLGMNLGLVLSPTIGGFLFKSHLGLAFLIDGVTTFMSTLLIILFIKKLKIDAEVTNEYEKKREGEGIWKILKERRTFFIYFFICGFAGSVYSQFNYLLPLNMESLYGDEGAKLFGMMTSVNAVVVIIVTPIVTTVLAKLIDIRKLLLGEILIVSGLFAFKFVQGMRPVYFILMTIFTIGEVLYTIGSQPYMTKRIPSTHWGRMNSIMGVFNGAFYAVGNLIFGYIVDNHSFSQAWTFFGLIGTISICLISVLVVTDRGQFPLLYEESAEEKNQV